MSFTPEQKLALARALDAAGVDMIEVGHPGAAADVDRAIDLIASVGLRAEIVVHCRAHLDDIRRAARLPVHRIAVFLGTSPVHLEKKLGLTRDQALARIREAVGAAAASGKRVRFSAEDAFRTDRGYLREVCGVALEAGADRIGLPDTVGAARPEAVHRLFRWLAREFPGVELDAHCHNDLGLAVANTLAAVRGGATCVHVSVNGLGERCGLAAMAPVAVALKVLYGIDTVALRALPALSRMVAEWTGLPVSPLEPVVGESAFSHKAGLHTGGVLRDPASYELFPPELLGRERVLVVDKLTGRACVRWRLERLGVKLDERWLERVVSEIKERAGAQALGDEELLRLAGQVAAAVSGKEGDDGGCGLADRR